MDEIARSLFARLVASEIAARPSDAAVCLSAGGMGHYNLERVARTFGIFMARTPTSIGDLVSHYNALRKSASPRAPTGDGLLPGVIDESLAIASRSFNAERHRMRHAGVADIVHRMRGRLNVVALVGQMWREDVAGASAEGAAEILLRQVEEFEPLFAEMLDAIAPPPCSFTCIDLEALCREALLGPGVALIAEREGSKGACVDAFRIEEAIDLMMQRCSRYGGLCRSARLSTNATQATFELDGDGRLPTGTAIPSTDVERELGWMLIAQTAAAHGGSVSEDGTTLRLVLQRQLSAAPM